MVRQELDDPDLPTADDAGFLAWAASRMPTLRRRAYLLSGDWHTADDLVQESLAGMFKSWPRIARGGNLDAYAARVMLHKLLDERRRPWRRETPVDAVPDRADRSSEQAMGRVERADDELARALRSLPPGQRAVVVLRYGDDLPLEQIAAVLGVRPGTVKSRLSRATESLRRELAPSGAPAGSPSSVTRAPRSLA
ncbi:MAG TPA: SigE family RNA polymerase sigma factor [Acidimicrobiales bacterium]|nr:SigE family RNA polymerase sigma factor [Acidimicrobiales bacterium]